ncbi:hypothetical protein Tco_1385326 [Tanacetum coccineum]
MANLEFCDKHNMVAYLIKSEGSKDFHEIIDFLFGSHISYALTESLILYMSLIEQFWQTTTLSTTEDGVQAITTTIDGREIITIEASLRRHLKLEDSAGLPSLPNEEIFEQLTNMRVIIPLFDTMLVQPQGEAPSTSPSRITSSPSYHITSSIPTTSSSIQTHHDTEEPVTMPHDSPLYSVHSHRSDDGRLKQTILTDLVTKLSDRVKVLEKDLQQTKKTYSTALTKLVLRVEKLENQLKSGKARRRVGIILSEDEDEKQSDDIEVLIEEEEPTELVEDQGSGEKGEREVSIAGAELSTRKDGVNTASGLISTADVTTASDAGIKAKDKGKGIMQESEPSKKIKKRVQIQMTVDQELAKKLFEEEQARFNAEQKARAKEEQKQEKSDFEIA